MKAISATFKIPRVTVALSGLFGDPVLLVLLLAFSTLAVFDGPQAGASLGFTFDSMLHIAPFFLLAIAVTGYTKASGADSLIARAFDGNQPTAITAGSLAGALSPFCSCGVIPLIAAMLRSGVPLAPVMAFCIASPIMDPEMFILTAAGINLNFAIAKTIAAIGMGLMAGLTVLGLQRFGWLRHVLKSSPVCSSCQPALPSGKNKQVRWRFWQHADRRTVFSREIRQSGLFLGKWMTLAFFIESLMVAYIPAEWIGELVGSDSIFAVPLAALIGIPAYLNGYAAIPLVSGLVEIGMSPGAAMAFVTAGAVSSIPAALAVYALVKKPVFLLYLAVGLAGSILAGYLYNLVLLLIN